MERTCGGAYPYSGNHLDLSGSNHPHLSHRSGNRLPTPPPPQPPKGYAGKGRGTDGPSCARLVRRDPAVVCGSPTWHGHGRRCVGRSFPFASRPWGKGHLSLPPPLTLCVWCCGRQGPTPHLGCGGDVTRQDGRAGHPQPGPEVRPAVFPASIWGQVALQGLPPIALPRQKNVSLMKPSPDLACAGRGFTLWLTRQGTVKASTHGGADASFLAQQLDGRLAPADYLWTAARFYLATIPSGEEALCGIGTFVSVASHLFSAGGWHSSAVAELLHLITRLEELHTEVQGMISPPHLSTTLLFNVPRRRSLYHNRCIAALA